MTFLEAQTQVILKAKLTASDASQLQLVKDEINRAIYDLAMEKKIAELMFSKYSIVLNGVVGLLPANFLIENRVYISVASRTWDLTQIDGLVPPAPVYGKPTCYEINGGYGPLNLNTAYDLRTIEFLPDDVAGSSIFMDYYRRPPVLVADGDLIVTVRWDAEIIRRACTQIAIRENKLEQASMLRSTDGGNLTQTPTQS